LVAVGVLAVGLVIVFFGRRWWRRRHETETVT
jgi:hypothetical protein